MYYYNLNFYIVSFIFCVCCISLSIIKGIELYYKIKFFYYIPKTNSRSNKKRRKVNVPAGKGYSPGDLEQSDAETAGTSGSQL